MLLAGMLLAGNACGKLGNCNGLYPQFEDGASISPLVSFGVPGKPNSNNNRDVGPLIFHAGRGCADDPTGRWATASLSKSKRMKHDRWDKILRLFVEFGVGLFVFCLVVLDLMGILATPQSYWPVSRYNDLVRPAETLIRGGYKFGGAANSHDKEIILM